MTVTTPSTTAFLSQMRQFTNITLAQPSLDGQGLSHLKRAVSRGLMDQAALGAYRQLREVVAGCGPASPQPQVNLQGLDHLLKPDVGTGFLDRQRENHKIAVPFVHDPRAVILPRVRIKDVGVFFVNGFDPNRNTFSQIFFSQDQDGALFLMIRVQNAETGEVIKVRRFGERVFTDDKTQTVYFSLTPYSDSPVFALGADPDNEGELKLIRYPSYDTAGLIPPIMKSTVVGYKGRGKKNEHYYADIFISEKEKIEIAIIENENGEVEKVVDYRLGHEFLPQAMRFNGKPTYQINDQLQIALTRRSSEGKYYYQVEILHHLGEQRQASFKGRAIMAVALHAENLFWGKTVDAHVRRLKASLAANFQAESFLQELHKIRKEEGMRIAHEVIMALYFDEQTQMDVVTALKQSRGLPLPVDSRIIPASADTLTSLCEYLTQQGATGYLSRSILKAAQKKCAVPAQYIHGLWLSLKNPTLAAMNYFKRGASTPEYVVGGVPVMGYRRVIDESYTGIANSDASRESQRERIRDLLSRDAISASFKHYLGMQLDLASAFDLLILDSGHLYYNDKRVHPLGYSNDREGLKVIDDEGDLFEIPRERPGVPAYTKPLLLSAQNIATKKHMLEVHPDDPFRFVWLSNRDDEMGGSYSKGTILVKNDQGGFTRPSAKAIADSMQGLIDLPANYLSAEHIKPVVDFDLESIKSLDDFEYQKGEPVEIDLGEYGHKFDEIPHRKLKMIPYYVQAGDAFIEIYIPSPDSQTANVLASKGYYVAKEADLAKIIKYYLHVARQGYLPFRSNLYLMPGMMDGILGFYRFNDESMFVSSRKAKNFEEWAAKMFFNTIRHEMGHAIHRVNPWISSLLYRCMALDGVSMDYGQTNINEYWSVLVQNFFDHPQNRYRFPNGYKLIYTLIKLRERGVAWDGPHHRVMNAETGELEDLPFARRNIDGTSGALRALANGGNP